MADLAIAGRAPHVHRRIPLRQSHMKVDQATGKAVRPSSAAFAPDKDGLSVYLHSALEQRGVELSVVRTNPEQAIAGLEESSIKDAGLFVQLDPDGGDVNQDRGAAHALVKGWEGMSKGQAAVAKDTLACACFCTYPGGAWPHPVS